MEKKELQEGSKAPSFTLLASNGEKVSLGDYLGKWIVLYFYPKDDTPGCTKEACNFRDRSKEFKKKNAVMLGVSLDDLTSHQKFIQKYDLPFLLLSDTDKKVSEAYGIYKEKNNYGKKYWGIERSTFLIDSKGNIAKIWRRVQVEGHDAEILESME